MKTDLKGMLLEDFGEGFSTSKEHRRGRDAGGGVADGWQGGKILLSC